MSSKIETARLEAHVRKLASEIGPRESGSHRDEQAIEHICDCLKGFGVEYSLHELRIPCWEHIATSLVLPETGEELPAHACTYSVACNLSAEVMPLKSLANEPGAWELQVSDGGVAEKVCMVNSGDLGRKPSIVALALEAYGAAALLVAKQHHRPEAYDGKVVREPSLRRMPVASISENTRDKILGSGGKVHLRIDARFIPWGPTHNVVARIGEAEGGRCFVTAHHDTGPGSPGALDDGTSIAIALELARILAADPGDHETIIIFTGGEERLGLGSILYVREYENLVRGAQRLVNLDEIGVKTGVPTAKVCGPDWFVEALESRLSAWPSMNVARFDRLGGDVAPFTEVGVPAVWLQSLPEDEFYTNLRHTQFDDLDAVDIANVQELGEVALALCTKL